MEKNWNTSLIDVSGAMLTLEERKSFQIKTSLMMLELSYFRTHTQDSTLPSSLMDRQGLERAIQLKVQHLTKDCCNKFATLYLRRRLKQIKREETINLWFLWVTLKSTMKNSKTCLIQKKIRSLKFSKQQKKESLLKVCKKYSVTTMNRLKKLLLMERKWELLVQLKWTKRHHDLMLSSHFTLH